MNRYRKISICVVFDAPRVMPGEEHRSRSVGLKEPSIDKFRQPIGGLDHNFPRVFGGEA
jgi:hypothetical protein